MEYPKTPRKENSSISQLALEYYKKYGQNRDLQQYFTLSTPINLSEEKLVPDVEYINKQDLATESKLVNSVKLCQMESRNKVGFVRLEERIIKKSDAPEIIVEDTETGRLSSASSCVSDKRLEWDSGADVGYNNYYAREKSTSLPSLSTVCADTPRPNIGSDTQINDKIGYAESTPKVMTLRFLRDEDNDITAIGRKENNLHKSESKSLEDTRSSEPISLDKKSSSHDSISRAAVENLIIYSPTVIKLAKEKCLSKDIQTEDFEKKSDKSEIYFTAENTSDPDQFSPKLSPRKIPKSTSFEFERISNHNGSSDKTSTTNSETDSTSVSSGKSIGSILVSSQYSTNLSKDLQSTVNALKTIVDAKKYSSKEKRRLVRKIVKKIVNTDYDEDSPEDILKQNVPWTPVSFATTVTPNSRFPDSSSDKSPLPKISEELQIDDQLTSRSSHDNNGQNESPINWKQNLTFSEKLFQERIQYLQDHPNKPPKLNQKFQNEILQNAFQEGESNQKFLDYTEKERQEQLKWVKSELYHLNQLKILLETKSQEPSSESQKSDGSLGDEITIHIQRVRNENLVDERPKTDQPKNSTRTDYSPTDLNSYKETATTSIYKTSHLESQRSKVIDTLLDNEKSSSWKKTESSQIKESIKQKPELNHQSLENCSNSRRSKGTIDKAPQSFNQEQFDLEGYGSLTKQKSLIQKHTQTVTPQNTIQYEPICRCSKQVGPDLKYTRYAPKGSIDSSHLSSRKQSIEPTKPSEPYKLPRTENIYEADNVEPLKLPTNSTTESNDSVAESVSLEVESASENPSLQSTQSQWSYNDNPSKQSTPITIKRNPDKYFSRSVQTSPHLLPTVEIVHENHSFGTQFPTFQSESTSQASETYENKRLTKALKSGDQASSNPSSSRNTVEKVESKREERSYESTIPSRLTKGATNREMVELSGTSSQRNSVLQRKVTASQPKDIYNDEIFFQETPQQSSSRSAKRSDTPKSTTEPTSYIQAPSYPTHSEQNGDLDEQFDYTVKVPETVESKRLDDLAIKVEQLNNILQNLQGGQKVSTQEVSNKTQSPDVTNKTESPDQSKDSTANKSGSPKSLPESLHFFIEIDRKAHAKISRKSKKYTEPMRISGGSPEPDNFKCKESLKSRVEEMLSRCDKCKQHKGKNICNCKTRINNIDYRIVDPTLNQKNWKNMANFCHCQNVNQCQGCGAGPTKSSNYFLRVKSQENIILEQKPDRKKSIEEVNIYVPDVIKKGEVYVPNQVGTFVQYQNPGQKHTPLKDFLLMNNPKFVHQADERRSYMLNRMSERQLKAEIFKNHVVKTATSDINRFSQELIRTQKFRTLPKKRYFTTKIMKDMTRKKYRKCAEVVEKKQTNKSREELRANYFMKQLFAMKLQQNVRHGKLDHSFGKNVI